MKKQRNVTLAAAGGALTAFALWTLLVRVADVQPIGPLASAVGLATVNGAFHRFTGVHWSLYHITDWMGLIPFAIVFAFALLGLWQWITRKHLLRVDRDILILGGFYLATLAAYLLFEVVAVNYRPVLIEGVLEISYPSSTTMLALCVFPTAAMQLHRRISNPPLRHCAVGLLVALAIFMVACRLLSGVHWLTDIVGGILLSTGLVLSYRTALLS